MGPMLKRVSKAIDALCERPRVSFAPLQALCLLFFSACAYLPFGSSTDRSGEPPEEVSEMDLFAIVLQESWLPLEGGSEKITLKQRRRYRPSYGERGPSTTIRQGARTYYRYEGIGTIRLSDELLSLKATLYPSTLWEDRYGPGGPLERDYEGYLLTTFTFEIENKAQDPMEIDWSKVRLMDPEGRSLPVVHQGIEPADLGRPMAASIIPPGERLKDFVFPIDYIVAFDGQKWKGVRFFERLQPGDRFGLFLPVKIGAQEIPHTLIFSVHPAKE